MKPSKLIETPITLLTFFFSATGASAGSITGTTPQCPIDGPAPTWIGARAQLSLITDTLSQRYDASCLAPFNKARQQMHRLLLSQRAKCPTWSKPVVNLGADGELELQWWRGEKSLTLTLDGEKIFFLKAWGVDPQNDMDDGEIEAEGFLSLWEWLQE